MFIAFYEFQVVADKHELFRQSWLTVTKKIYQYCGSYGSRLHQGEDKNTFIGYAQWENREQWEQSEVIDDAEYHQALKTMRSCLVERKVAYELEVCDDYLQTMPFEATGHIS